MSSKQNSFDSEDEGYIDIELSSSSNILSISIDSPPQTAEFEFQMLSYSNEKEPATSSAEELFYKGKLLPLHLPPRLQMVRDLLLQGSNSSFQQAKTDTAFESCGVPLKNDLQRSQATYSVCSLGSCSVSDSCKLSCEFNLDEHLFHWPDEMNGFAAGSVPKVSWCKKLKQIKLGLLGPRLNASKAYIRSLFNIPGCSPAQSASSNAACNIGVKDSRVYLPGRCKKVDRKNQFGAIARRSYSPVKERNKEMQEHGVNHRRRSFSGAVQWNSTTDYSSTSFASSSSSSCAPSSSSSSTRFSGVHWIKRTGVASSENENSIEGAIAHCKRSQQLRNSIATKIEARV